MINQSSLLLATAILTGATYAPLATASEDGKLNAQLNEVRQATAKFHSLDAAAAAGWDVTLTGCIAHPDPNVGGMGYHYVNQDIFFDATVDPLRPETLVYAPTPSGGLQLVAVEYIVFTAQSATPPELFGETFHLNPAINAWVLHAWIWKPNPSGILADFNPNVSCP